jgi:putative colanic acid biosynthesis UDP-glucose lipid carrier transferase
MLSDAEGLQNVTDPAGFPAATAWQNAPRTTRLLRRPGLSRTLQLGIKRGFDVVASLGLLIFFAPLFLVIALAILAVDRMPVLYRQQRYGRGGRPFTILKFRTMTVAEAGRDFTQAVPGDSRITPLGAYLRRTSLDELPQLLNVLVGQMSLVGPRPHALTMEERNFALYPYSIRRLDMRPGMTGLAQVRGLRGPTRRANDLPDRLGADVEYVDGWSFARDIRILGMTPAAWLFGHNAH